MGSFSGRVPGVFLIGTYHYLTSIGQTTLNRIRMRTLVPCLFLALLAGGRPEHKHVYTLYGPEPDRPLEGIYQVDYKMVNGDTLWSKTGINKAGYATNTVRVMYLNSHEILLSEQVTFLPAGKHVAGNSYGVRTRLTPDPNAASYSFSPPTTAGASGKISAKRLSLRLKRNGYDLRVYARK
ncbi:hypothetical protein [Spirosoma sp. KUDC1026]|uniref:hypothetical protein n=1 Tax=Spirosoma sp. KUDC1026 TaxID=2745947 RepID=UPI00159BE8AF|nr:hypothetical protein [Spirosoma sp. KUDC1026]QKZ13987.1 hypothetical protein HU175_15665 [Spirosoma sp. KUDC1026]